MGQSLEEKNIEEDTQKVAAEVQLRKYGVFFEEYQRQLDLVGESLRHRWNFPQTNYTQLDSVADEQLDSIQDLINSENKIIDKVVAIFCKLCGEVSFIEHTAKHEFIDTICHYGESLAEDAPVEDCQLLVSKILPTLQRLSDLVAHCERVLDNILCQLSAFYRLHLEIADASLHTVFDAIANLLLTLLMLEETLSNNQTLLYHWTLYRRTIQLALHKASEFSYHPVRIRQLNKLIERLETRLLSGNLFEMVLNSNLERKLPIKQNKRLEEEFGAYLKHVHSELEKILVKQNCTDMTRLMKLCLIFALHVNLFGSYDRKLLRSIGDICKKFSLVTLRSNILVSLDAFFIKHVTSFLKQSERKMFERDRQRCAKSCLTEITHNMNKEVQHYTSHILRWILQLEAKFGGCAATPLTADHMEDVCKLLLDGVNVNRQLKALIITVSNLHMTVSQPMYKTSAISFCKLVELIKCVNAVYARHHDAIFKVVNYVVQFMQHQCLAILRASKQPVSSSSVSGGSVSEKRFKEVRVDAMSSLVIAEYCLCGPPSANRLTAVKLCLNLAAQAKCLSDQDRERLHQLLQKISTISSLMAILEDVSACRFMYWNQSTLPLYLEEVERKELDISRIQCMFDAIEDCIESPSQRSWNTEIETDQLSAITRVSDAFLQQVTQPICRKMEENLRLQVLSYLQPNIKYNYELNAFARAESLSLAGCKRLDLRYQVETYLDRTFYDLTTVALHDWQTYGEMRTLAAHKFGLTTVDDGLPNHTLEQGPDLLEITRTIHTFVANHFYNLNNQIFVEASSNNKHVNVINIRHTANSIRTHGAGITSTAVNYTYQFLRSKLNLVSQFLYDEQIKSRLVKEVAAINEQQPLNLKYPYERAERLYRSVRQLGAQAAIGVEGVAAAGYVDQFRTLVTHMGNALGYVRLIRSGSLRYFSDATAFIPDLKKVAQLDTLCAEAATSEECIEAGRILGNVIANMCHNIAEGSNYFKLLVDVFANVASSSGNEHLLYFYAIVPVLSLNFVEYLITAKEGLSKKTSKTTRVTFTDDGFAIGVVYLLHTLKQYAKFESLQWFQSVEERNTSARSKLESQIAATPKEDSKLNHTLNLSLKRLDVFQQEFRHLRYNMNSAQVLFQTHRQINDSENS